MSAHFSSSPVLLVFVVTTTTTTTTVINTVLGIISCLHVQHKKEIIDLRFTSCEQKFRTLKDKYEIESLQRKFCCCFWLIDVGRSSNSSK
jgi:hypothetical protein